jgi:hypothetical protein
MEDSSLEDREKGEQEGDAGMCCTGIDSNIDEEEKKKKEKEAGNKKRRGKERTRGGGGRWRQRKSERGGRESEQERRAPANGGRDSNTKKVERGEGGTGEEREGSAHCPKNGRKGCTSLFLNGRSTREWQTWNRRPPASSSSNMDEQATHGDEQGWLSTFTVLRALVKGRECVWVWVNVDACCLSSCAMHVATWRMPERVWQARAGAEVKCRGRRRRRNWEEGEGRERRFHPKTYGWERQKHVVRKGFPVPPLLLPPVLQGEKRSRNAVMSTVFGRERQGTRQEGKNDETK